MNSAMPMHADRNETDRDGGDNRPGKVYEALSVSAIGIEMALAIFVGWGIGYWLDGRFGTGPYLMILFLGCGIAAAFKPLLRLSRKAKREAAESNEVPAASGDADGSKGAENDRGGGAGQARLLE